MTAADGKDERQGRGQPELFGTKIELNGSNSFVRGRHDDPRTECFVQHFPDQTAIEDACRLEELTGCRDRMGVMRSKGQGCELEIDFAIWRKHFAKDLPS